VDVDVDVDLDARATQILVVDNGLERAFIRALLDQMMCCYRALVICSHALSPESFVGSAGIGLTSSLQGSWP